MARIGGEHDGTAARRDAHRLQTHGVAADQMYRESRGKLDIAFVEAHTPGVHAAHHPDHILHLIGAAKALVRHVPAGGVAHLQILEVQRRVREKVEVADVVVVQMGDHHILHQLGIAPKRAEPLRRAPDVITTSLRRHRG